MIWMEWTWLRSRWNWFLLHLTCLDGWWLSLFFQFKLPSAQNWISHYEQLSVGWIAYLYCLFHWAMMVSIDFITVLLSFRLRLNKSICSIFFHGIHLQYGMQRLSADLCSYCVLCCLRWKVSIVTQTGVMCDSVMKWKIDKLGILFSTYIRKCLETLHCLRSSTELFGKGILELPITI